MDRFGYDKSMGLIHSEIVLRNASRADLGPITTRCLVDAGSMHLCIPEHIAIQLGFDLVHSAEREATLANGKVMLCKYVGPIQLEFRNRSCFVGALVLGNQVLLGAVPMEDLDLVVVPSRLTVDVNPNSPNIPSSVVTRLCGGV